MGRVADSLDRVAELLRIAGRVGDGKPVVTQRHADVIDDIAVHFSRPGLDLVQRQIIADTHEDAGLVEEGFLVAVEDGLVADLQLVAVAAQGDQTDGRRGGIRQRGLGGFTDVRTRGQLNLLLRQFHGESETRGKSTVFAIGLGK